MALMMKARQTVCFIFLVLFILAVMAYFFPAEGLHVGGMTLSFPSLVELLGVDGQRMEACDADSVGTDTMVTEEIIAFRREMLRKQKLSAFMEYCESVEARIYMPNGDISYLDPLFEALENAREVPMRIMHYGDSQLECDRITSVLRENIQAEFGGGGVGLVPAVQTIGTYTLSQMVSREDLVRHLAYGPASMRLPKGDRRYGVMAQSASISGRVSFRFSTRERECFPCASKFSRVKLLTSAPITAEVIAGSDTFLLKEVKWNDDFYVYSTSLNWARTMVRLTVDGVADVYGIVLDRGGVGVDNIPMRGCSGTIFTSISSATLAPFYRHENVRLIILQYGGNNMPYIKGEKDIEKYMAGLSHQIKYLKRLAPEACILFIGPSDMAIRTGGVLQTYPMLAETVEALKHMADSTGIAYWDLYAVMGGHNSMLKWVASGLAGSDYVHFTEKGARHVGNILYETFEYYYKFYRFRLGKDSIEVVDDSVGRDAESRDVWRGSL